MSANPPAERRHPDPGKAMPRPPLSISYNEMETLINSNFESTDITTDDVFDVLKDVNQDFLTSLREIHNSPETTHVYEDTDFIVFETDTDFWSGLFNPEDIGTPYPPEFSLQLMVDVHRKAATDNIPEAIGQQWEDNHPIVLSKTDVFQEVEGYVQNRHNT